LRAFALASAYLMAGWLAGIAVGSFLHQPTLRHRGMSFLFGCTAAIATILLPPVQSALRDASAEATAPGLALLAAATAFFAGCVVASSWLVANQSR
jgi:hypothetical protein